MKKIIHIITCLGQGGAESMLYKLLTNMDKSQFKNTVISMLDEGVFGEKIKALGIPLYCLEMKSSKFTLKNFLHYRKLVQSIKPDIVQAWMYHANVFSVLAKPLLPAHKIFFNVRASLDGLEHEKGMTQVMVKLNALFSNFVTGVINNSIVSQQQHAEIGFSKKNAIYIGNGFDLSAYKPSIKAYHEFRMDRSYPAETKIVAMFARFHPIKNHLAFLEMAKVINTMYSDEIKFVMAGINVDTNNVELVKKIKELNLTSQIILLGNVNTADYLPVIDVLVSPSLGESFPNILGEAMACGIPCVATDVGDVRKILEEYGAVTLVNDIEGLAKHVINILSLDKNSYNILSARCVEHIKQRYNIQSVTKQYEQLYLQAEI